VIWRTLQGFRNHLALAKFYVSSMQLADDLFHKSEPAVSLLRVLSGLAARRDSLTSSEAFRGVKVK
jgi:hypothetical protein